MQPTTFLMSRIFSLSRVNRNFLGRILQNCSLVWKRLHFQWKQYGSLWLNGGVGNRWAVPIKMSGINSRLRRNCFKTPLSNKKASHALILETAVFLARLIIDYIIYHKPISSVEEWILLFCSHDNQDFNRSEIWDKWQLRVLKKGKIPRIVPLNAIYLISLCFTHWMLSSRF